MSYLPQPSPSADPAVTRLAASVAHELNNPLDAVLRYVSLAQRKAKSGDYSDLDRYLADAQFGLQRMAEILRELMDIGRETHETLTRPLALPLPDLVAHALRTISPLADQKHQTLTIKSLLPAAFAPTYDLRVSQILANLLKNAIEASPENATIRLTLSLADVDPSSSGLKTQDSRLVITVEDSGPGLPQSVLDTLFTPFNTTKPPGSGHGLGLAISRELALSLAGSLTLTNRTLPATGCLATLALPLTTNH